MSTTEEKPLFVEEEDPEDSEETATDNQNQKVQQDKPVRVEDAALEKATFEDREPQKYMLGEEGCRPCW